MFMEIVQAITGVFVIVYDGQHALKFTLGRATCVVGPGVNFKWPIIQHFRVVDTKDTTIDLEPQIIQLSDDLVYEVGAKAVYQIVDLHKALFIEIDNLVVGLKNRLVLIVPARGAGPNPPIGAPDGEDDPGSARRAAAGRGTVGSAIPRVRLLHLFAVAGNPGNHAVGQARRGEAEPVPASRRRPA